MLESSLKWFTLMAVATMATAPVLMFLHARGEEEGLKAAREALDHIKDLLQQVLTSPGEVELSVPWGEGGIPKRIAGGEVTLMIYPGHIRLYSSGELLASSQMPDFLSIPPPFIFPETRPSDLIRGQYHIPPFTLDPREELIIRSLRVGGEKLLFVYTRSQLAASRIMALHTAPIIYLRETLLREGGEAQFRARWDMLVGRGFAVLTLKVGGVTYHTLQWVPVEVLIGQVRGRVTQVEHLRVGKGDTPTLAITSAGYTMKLLRGQPSPGPVPE